jgi:hypothetical protein
MYTVQTANMYCQTCKNTRGRRLRRPVPLVEFLKGRSFTLSFTGMVGTLGSVAAPTGVRHTPSLLLFGHVEKTGGTSVRQWMQDAVRAGHLDLFVPYRFAPCYVRRRFAAEAAAAASEHDRCGPAFWRGLDRTGARSGMAVRGTRNASDVVWRDSRIALEFHAEGSLAAFVADVLPMMPALRWRYEQEGGVALAMVLLREPVQHLLSAYRMWPPCDKSPSRRRDCRLATSFATFAEGAAGAQAGRLTLQPGTPLRTATIFRRQSGMHVSAATGCAALVRSAQSALDAVDVVAPTDCLRSVLRSVARRLQLPRPHAMPFRRPVELNFPRAVREHVHEQIAALNRSDIERVLAAAQCDEQLYSLAVRRAKAELTEACPLRPRPRLGGALGASSHRSSFVTRTLCAWQGWTC